MAVTPRNPVLIVGVLILGWVMSGCAGGSSDTTAGSGKASAFVDVQMTSFALTVENRAGEPLSDVRVTIKAVGGFPQYTTQVPRLGAEEKATLTFRDFSSRDGTPFSLRAVRPKEVTVTAVAFAGGKKLELTTPWK